MGVPAFHKSRGTIATENGKAMPGVAIHSNIARMAAVFAVVQMRHSLLAEATVFSPALWRLPRGRQGK
ncbi:hypothetical protein B5K06_04560 [Rhizobium grahamii]|uniref:Uncharacterized protein n=1 Tax=Rhizobium grahamii TaxID=1120045 RepID=A0A370KUI7_9HYPH|nr:hypothetical protein B5K06_04560 [Rhizobium grahamii]